MKFQVDYNKIDTIKEMLTQKANEPGWWMSRVSPLFFPGVLTLDFPEENKTIGESESESENRETGFEG